MKTLAIRATRNIYEDDDGLTLWVAEGTNGLVVGVDPGDPDQPFLVKFLSLDDPIWVFRDEIENREVVINTAVEAPK